jgi:hypothetical protein
MMDRIGLTCTVKHTSEPVGHLSGGGCERVGCPVKAGGSKWTPYWPQGTVKHTCE